MGMREEAEKILKKHMLLRVIIQSQLVHMKS